MAAIYSVQPALIERLYELARLEGHLEILPLFDNCDAILCRWVDRLNHIRVKGRFAVSENSTNQTVNSRRGVVDELALLTFLRFCG